MTGWGLTGADERKLVGVNARLVHVVRLVAIHSPVRFAVIEGVRTKERQRMLVAAKKSKTMNSKHLIGRAVDCAPIVDGVISWKWEHFTPLVDCAKEMSRAVQIGMVFGYDWGWDAPHWELEEP